MFKTYSLTLLVFLFAFLANAQVDDGKLKILSTTNGQEEAAYYSKRLQESYANGEYELQKIYSDSLLLVANHYTITEMGILALNSQAVYYKNRGDRQKALELYHEALEKCALVPEMKGPKAMILVNMGNIYSFIGSIQKSIETMEALLEVTDTVKQFSKIRAAALVGLSTSHLELKNNTKAVYYTQEALKLGAIMQDEEVLSTALSTLSDVFIDEEKYELALVKANEGLQLQINQLRTKKRATLLLNNGIANYHLSQYESAITALQESLQISQDKNLLEIEMYCYKYIAKVYEEKGEFEKSYTAQKEYSRLRDTIQNDKKETAIVDLEKKITDTQETLNATQLEADVLTQKSKKILLYASIALLLLGGLLFFFIKKKKSIELENEDLQKEFMLLKQRIVQTPINDLKYASRDKNEQEVAYKNSSLTEEKRRAYKKHLITIMKTQKPYLNPDLRLKDLAAQLDMTTSHFSEVLHYGFEENFYNFINFYRVMEAQELLKKSSYADEKIIAVAFDSGFKSKTTFNRVFKNVTGVTPSDYRKTQQ